MLNNSSISNFTIEADDSGDCSSAIFLVIMWSLIFLTVIGNILVLISIVSQEKTRKILSNRFILSLSVADCMVGFFVMIPSALHFQHKRWEYGLVLCKVWNTIDVTFCSASIYNLIGISVDRFFAVHDPIGYVTKKRYWLVNLKIVAAWTMGLIISLPAHSESPGFSNWATLTEETVSENCAPPIDPDSVGFVVYSATLAFLLPCVFLATLQTAIFLKRRKLQNERLEKINTQVSMERAVLTRQQTVVEEFNRVSANKEAKAVLKKQLSFIDDAVSSGTRESEKRKRAPKLGELKRERSSDEASGTSLDADENSVTFTAKELEVLNNIGSMAKNSKLNKKLSREEAIQRQITTMMGVIIGAFVFCWAPFAFMFILFPTNEAAASWFIDHPGVIAGITWLGYVNSSLNPVIYAVLNKNIRHGIIRFFRRGRSKQ